MVQTGALAERVSGFALECLEGLGLANGAFHAEIIEHNDGLVFLEVGARVGGGEIPFVLHEVYGADLVGDWIRVELGDEPQTVPIGNLHTIAGFLMIPEPVGRRVLARPSMLGRIPDLYAEVLPEIGHVFDGKGGYDTLLGRFRYKGESADAVARAIEATLAGYSCVLEGSGMRTADRLAVG